MSVLIKGMEMPKRCIACSLLYDCFACIPLGKNLYAADINAEIDKERLPDCPLVEIKEPHGDLIDRDALLRGEGRYIIALGKEGIDVEEIKRAPTVIEAEGSDED